MTTDRRFVVISGIPASGKSTIGRALVSHLDMPLLDKDDVLEMLFDESGASNQRTRQRLSRSADRILQAIARRCRAAVLCSVWRHPASVVPSGTPSAWLRAPNARVVEVFCNCHPELDSLLSQSRELEG